MDLHCKVGHSILFMKIVNHCCERQEFFRQRHFRSGAGFTSLGDFFVHITVTNVCILTLASEKFVLASESNL